MSFAKVLHLTCADKNNLSVEESENYQSFIRLHEDYDIRIVDNNDIYRLFQENYPDYIRQIEQIKLSDILSILFSYYILHKEGGVYANLSYCKPRKSIEGLLSERYFHGDSEHYIFNKFYEESEHIVCNKPRKLWTDRQIHVLKCQGHDLINNHQTILGYIAHPDYETNLSHSFIISESSQPIFKNMLEESLNQLDLLVKLNSNTIDYIRVIDETCGSQLLTKTALELMNKQPTTTQLLSTEYFCNTDNVTDKTYIEIKQKINSEYFPVEPEPVEQLQPEPVEQSQPKPVEQSQPKPVEQVKSTPHHRRKTIFGNRMNNRKKIRYFKLT